MARRLSEEDDTALAGAAARGDRAAAEALLRRHHDMVLAVCRRIVLDRGGADDAAQEALVGVARGVASFDGRAQVRTWIYRIAVNAALDEVRRARRRPPPADPASTSWEGAAEHPHDASTEAAVVARDELHRALESLPEDFRAVMALRYLLDMEYADIATTLQVPIGTVRSRISRGTDLLRASLSGNPGAPSVRQKQNTGDDRGRTRSGTDDMQ